MRPFLVLLLSFLAVSVATCGGEPPPGASMVESSDPELKELVAGMLAEVSQRSGLEVLAPVRVEKRSREALELYLSEKLADELSREEEEWRTLSYVLLGLVPDDFDLRRVLLSVYTEQVAGFYDTDSTALFVLDDQPMEDMVPLLFHELTHALQDQAFDLDALTSAEIGADRRAAAMAAIEGHATLLMVEQMMEGDQRGRVDLSRLPDVSAQLRPGLESVRTGYPELARAPRVVQEAVLFPYLEGASFVQSVWLATGSREAPFGDLLPASTEQVMDPGRFLPTRDVPTSVRFDVDGGTIVFDDTLGQLEMGILGEEWSEGAVTGAGSGWDGDRYGLVETEADTGLVWVSVWDDVESRSQFTRALSAYAGRLPRPATFEEVEVEARPVLIVRVGFAGEVSVTLGSGGA